MMMFGSFVVLLDQGGCGLDKDVKFAKLDTGHTFAKEYDTSTARVAQCRGPMNCREACSSKTLIYIIDLYGEINCGVLPYNSIGLGSCQLL